MTAVVVADDDPRHRARTAAAVRSAGFLVRSARSAVHAGVLLRRIDVGAIIVDPAAGDPAAVVADLRSRTTVPIIVVSARAEELDKVAVLDAGADDYLTKPFGVEELLARLRASLRRATAETPAEAPIVTRDFTVHLAERRLVRQDDTEVRLTRLEWRILDELARRQGHLVSREELLVAVWGPAAIDKPGNVRVAMSNIRAKLEPTPPAPRYFLTSPGLGVRFDPSGGSP